MCFCRCVDLSTSVAIALKFLKTVLGNCEKFRVGEHDSRASVGSMLLSHGWLATHAICNRLPPSGTDRWRSGAALSGTNGNFPHKFNSAT